jgi:hypothetical protein
MCIKLFVFLAVCSSKKTLAWKHQPAAYENSFEVLNYIQDKSKTTLSLDRHSL